MSVNILAIVQARADSKRLPNKVLEKINGMSLIEILLNRLSKSKHIDKVIVATGKDKVNDSLSELVKNLEFDIFRGESNDVLRRFYHAAKQFEASSIVRITGDCPLIDNEIIDKVISLYKNENVDYASNIDPPTFPDGLDVEVFSFKSLKEANKYAIELYDREHVTPFIRNNKKIKKANLYNSENKSKERWTLDYSEDLVVIKNILNHFYPDIHFKSDQIIYLKKIHPELFDENKNIQRNTGSLLGKGQKLYKNAKRIIPGGTMLLSKRPELFLPEIWPAYFSKAKGCKVWDLEGVEYIDMSIMGIGTNTLGYAHPEVDEEVVNAVKRGNMSTLNCPEEVFLAERLIELHPWSDMVRFARTGGEANAIAVRIARAAVGKEKIAICGYHGWHDWYLSANLGDDSSLDGHLIPGLDPKGVPPHLKGSVIPFHYNNPDELSKVVQENDIGIIKMEVSRSIDPKEGYLQFVRKLATENNIILIFDECTSGFRETFGGLHRKFEVFPDMMILGKALGNGYAITAVLGTEEIMKFAEATFISSTFWTERIGPTAALKSLEIMEREKSWIKITNIGIEIVDRWEKLSKSYNLPLKISGLPSLAEFTIKSSNWIKYKTLISQEMLKNGFLASNLIYSCIEHNSNVLDQYFDRLESIFSIIKDCEEGRDIDILLEGPICHTGFRRLN